ncbi:MAG: hypothetical protein GY778_28885 [bacterium]|nr:hypothetical protein [bacterium]
MPGNDFRFYGTTGPGGVSGGSQPDQTLWTGRHRASQRLDELQSTLTATQTIGNERFITDSARIGDGADVHAMKWILIQTGPAAMEAARVQVFDNATGQFTLDSPLPALAQSGDDYALFAPGNAFPDLTDQESEDGEARYRCVFWRNEHGASVADVRVHIQPLMADMDQWARLAQASVGAPFLTLTDEFTSPLNDLGQRQLSDASDNFAGSGGLTKPTTRASADAEVTTVANNAGLAIFLERIIPTFARRRRSVAILLTVSTTTAGSDPDPLTGGAILVWDVEGVQPAATAQMDRFVHLEGGGRLETEVTSDLTGAPIADRPVKFAVATGDPGTIVTTNDPVTDFETTNEDGEAAGTYLAPASGTTADVEVQVPFGEEVGNP